MRRLQTPGVPKGLGLYRKDQVDVNRILKRFRREHRIKKTKLVGFEDACNILAGMPPSRAGEWCFHLAEWGDLTVSVMPRTVGNQVFDSNTGVVIKAPYHKTLRGGVVVNDGRAVNCDDAALSYTITGKRCGNWRGQIPLRQVYTVPNYRVPPEDINDAWRDALESLSRSTGREQAEAALEMTLGWCTDSISCSACGLCIPGHFVIGAVEQARAFGWGMSAGNQPVCPSHGSIVSPFPSNQELEKQGAFA